MAWHCTMKCCITKHCNAKHGIVQRRKHNTAQHVMSWRQVSWRVNGSSSKSLGWSGVAVLCLAPWAPRRAPHKAGLMESSRWLCLQHRLLKAET
eukprot:2253338-Pyramimonas_sp.AAC.1